MLNVKYNLTSYNSYLADMAAGFNAVYARKVSIKNNRLVFPESLAKGTLACYDVDTNLALVILDCVFFEDIRFERLPDATNYFHAMSFNLTTFSLMVNTDGNEKQVNRESWRRKILYSTAEKSLAWVAPKNIPVRILVLLLSREWVINKYRLETIQHHIPYQKELLEDAPMQFVLDFDLEILLLLQEVIESKPPAFLVKLFYKGYAKRLIALALEREAGRSKVEKLQYEDVVRVLNEKNALAVKLEQQLPSLDELAKKCFMSQSKFSNIFKAMYGKNYVHFFQELRMKNAALLLQKGQEIVDVANAVGFVNHSHFTRIFKEYFKVSPRTYRTMSRE